VFWVLLTMGSGRLVQFATLLILAKLLLPEDFGLVALGFILINFLVIFRELGLGAALIQRQTDLDEAYTAALVLFPVIGIVLYGLAYLVAPVAADFFGREAVGRLIRWMALAIPIAGFGILPTTLVQKYLAFQRKLLPELSAAVVYGVVAIVLAYRGYGAFSIAFGYVAAEVARSAGYWMLCPIRIRWRPSFRVAGQILGFGQKVTAGSLAIYVFNNMDQFSIGKLLGDVALGFYSFAFRVANFPTVNITHVINQVLLPVFSLIQTDRERFRSGYITTTRLIMSVTVPIAVGLVLFGREGLVFLYDTKWLPAVGVLQVLAVYGMLRSLGSTFGNVLIVNAIPQWLFYGAGLQIVIAVGAILLGAAGYGIVGIAVVMMVALFFGIALNWVKVSRLLGLGIGDWLHMVGLPLVVSLVVIGAIRLLFPEESGAWVLAKVGGAAVIYLLSALVIYRSEIQRFIQDVQSGFR
jgi:lipopolysaccharide exporter